MSKLWNRAIKYLRRYGAKPGKHRRNRAEYYLNTTILDMLRQWRQSWDHIGQHRFVRTATSYVTAGASHWGDWYDEPTAPWAAVDAGPWWSPVPIGAASTVVSYGP